MRLHRLALFGAAVAVIPACTSEGGSSFFIVQNQVASEGCIVPSDVGSGFRSKGTIEVQADTGYIFTPVVQSLLQTTEAGNADRVIFIQGADVTLSFPRGEYSDAELESLRADGLAYFRQQFSGSLFPAGTTSFGFEIVPKALLDDIGAKLVEFDTSTITVNAEVKMFGTVDGSDIEAEPFFYNVDVCNGCLVEDLGSCSALPEGLTIDQGGECQRFQDAPVDCCTDETLGVLCPAVATTAGA